MKTIVQLSDLHFGRTDSRIVAALLKTVNHLRPDAIVVSGDLTQRAKKIEFAAVKQFLSSLDFPKVVVPGNHDIPFYNIWRRFYKPLRRFHEVVSPSLSMYADSEMMILGLNTARSSVFKGGRLNQKQIDAILYQVTAEPASLVKIAVSHHPITEIALPGAMEQLETMGVKVFLAGHRHKTTSLVGEKSLLIQAGTATSIRYRDESNSFNQISLDAQKDSLKVTVISHSWDSTGDNFVAEPAKEYVLPF